MRVWSGGEKEEREEAGKERFFFLVSFLFILHKAINTFINMTHISAS